MNKNFLILLLTMSLDAFAYSIFNVVFPLYLDYMHISLPTIGLIFALPTLFYMLLRLLVGAEADIHGRKIFYSIALFLSSLTKFLFTIATNVWNFFFIQVFDKVSTALYDSVDHILVYEAVEKKKVGDAFGKINGLGSVLGFLGALIAGFLLLLLGYINTIVFCGLILLIGFLIFFKFGEKKFKKTHYGKLSDFLDVGNLTRNMKIYTFSRFFYNISNAMVMFFGIQLFLTKFLNASPETLSITVGLSTLFYGISAFFLGKLSDRFPSNKLCLVVFILGGALTIFMGLFASVLLVSFLWILFGAVTGVSSSPMGKMINEYSRSKFRGKDTNISATIFSSGSFIGPLLAGFLSSFFFPLVFVWSGVFLIIAGLFLRLIRD